MAVLLVTDRTDPHVSRFSEALKQRYDDFQLVTILGNGDSGPSAVVSGHEYTGWTGLSQALEHSQGVIISGPLDSVTSRIISLKNPHIGVSWATDLMVTAAGNMKNLEVLSAAVRALDAVVTDNVAAENALISMGVSPDRIIRFAWGPEIPSSSVSPSSEPEAPRAERKVLFGRSIEDHYYPFAFIDAVEQLNRSGVKANWCLIESGSLVDRVKEAIGDRRLEAQFSWIAAQSPSGFAKTLRECDVFVSTPRTDGTSVSLLEAMEAETLVVSTLTNGSAEWVIDGITGLSCSPGNPSSLALAIERALNLDSAYRNSIVSNARRLVQSKAGWQEGVRELFRAIDLNLIDREKLRDE